MHYLLLYFNPHPAPQWDRNLLISSVTALSFLLCCWITGFPTTVLIPWQKCSTLFLNTLKTHLEICLPILNLSPDTPCPTHWDFVLFTFSSPPTPTQRGVGNLYADSWRPYPYQENFSVFYKSTKIFSNRTEVLKMIFRQQYEDRRNLGRGQMQKYLWHLKSIPGAHGYR